VCYFYIIVVGSGSEFDCIEGNSARLQRDLVVAFESNIYNMEIGDVLCSSFNSVNLSVGVLWRVEHFVGLGVYNLFNSREE